jgi:Sulfotransferase domain
MTTSTQPFARNRRQPAAWQLLVFRAVALGIFLPISKLFGRGWARWIGRSMTAYVPAAHDVLICSYFKSGTNWTMQMALQIAYRGGAEFEHIHDLVPWPDVAARTMYALPLDDDGPRLASPTGLKVIKTHLALGAVPYSPVARYVCVVRDPKDVFVSSYHFARATFLGPLMPSVSEWLDAYLSPNTPIGSWAEHVASYWAVRDRPNVLFLTYESMRGDLPGTVDKIAALMGVTLSTDERAAVIERSTFDYMKKIGEKFDPPGSPWGTARGAMMRRGQRGASSELLSAADQRRIDDYWRAELERLQCDLPYDEAFGIVPLARQSAA